MIGFRLHPNQKGPQFMKIQEYLLLMIPLVILEKVVTLE
jgi:hypothetical protein